MYETKIDETKERDKKKKKKNTIAKNFNTTLSKIVE